MNEIDRERAVELVQQAYSDGRLQPDDLDRHLELALTATSWNDLRPIVGDLPDDDVRLESVGGRITRAGDWPVPRRLLVTSEYGRVRLDLSRALIRHPVVDLELQLTYGGARIILPPGATADTDGVRTVWGTVTRRTRRSRPTGGPHLRITGELTYGRLTLRGG